MELIIGEKLQNKKPTIEFCKDHGLGLFNDYEYKPLEILGEGAFGKVYKAMWIKNREMMAVKKITIQGLNKEEMSVNIATFLVEREALKLVDKINNPNLASFKGNFFTVQTEKSKRIQELVLVTEAGDFNLKNLTRKRREQGINPPYTPEEALKILIPLSKAYKALQKNRIYHSDTKLANIVYSTTRKSFIIIDFGISNVLSSKDSFSEEIEMCKFVRGGTKSYSSPEKRKHIGVTVN